MAGSTHAPAPRSWSGGSGCPTGSAGCSPGRGSGRPWSRRSACRPAGLILVRLGWGGGGVAGLFARDLPAGALTIVAAIAALFGVIGLLQLIAAVQVQLSKPQKPRG